MSKSILYIPPVLTDLIGAALLFWLAPPLAERFSSFSGSNAMLITGAFAVLCVAVSLTKRLEGSGEVLKYKRPLAGLAVFLVLVFTLSVMDVWGYLSSVPNLTNEVVNEGQATTYLLVPATWIGVGLVYMLVLTTESAPQTAAPGTPRFWLFSVVGLAGANLMLLVFTAYGRALWLRGTFPGGVAGFAIALLLLLLLAAPSRVFYAVRYRAWSVYLPLLGALLLAAWLVVGGG